MSNDTNYENGMYRYNEGVLGQVARDDYELPCRSCGRTVTEATERCPSCGIYAPGIYSACPSCGSKKYIWKPYGRNNGAMLGGFILGGPIGGIFGAAFGSNDAECICLKCGQGWLPYSMTGGSWLSTTRKFKLKKNTPQADEKVAAQTKTNRTAEYQANRYTANGYKAKDYNTSTDKGSRDKENKVSLSKMVLVCFVAVICVLGIGSFIVAAIEEKQQKELELGQERRWEERIQNQLHNNELSVDEYTRIDEIESLSEKAIEQGLELSIDYEMRRDLNMEFLNISYPSGHGIKIYYFEDLYPNLTNLRATPDFLGGKYVTIVNMDEEGERILGIHSNVLPKEELKELMERLNSIFESEEEDSDKVLGYFISSKEYLNNLYKEVNISNSDSNNDYGMNETENEEKQELAESCNIYLEDLYYMLSNDYSLQQVKENYAVKVVSEFDTLVEYYGYFGKYRGYFHYGTGVPVYGLDGEHTIFSWSGDLDTTPPEEYINGLYDLDYVDSGYHKDAKVTVYNWENKLLVSVLEAENTDSSMHALIQVVLYDEEIKIRHW